MSYSETVAYLFQQFPMYQNQGAIAYKADLGPITELLDLLEHPEQQFPAIHVAGTNGKGSVSHLLASALQANGYSVGLYTSPHLLDFRERIKINGQCIPETTVVEFVASHKEVFEAVSPSFFEWSVALAFHHFAQNKVDIAVIEVGMGGRLDATNVILPKLSVITNIGLDHQRFLGDTLSKIAVEKAGIIKHHIPVVIGETQSETTRVFQDKAAVMHAPITFADQQPRTEFTTDLKGAYQQRNLQTAAIAMAQLKSCYSINDEQTAKGFQSVIPSTNLMGRWQVLQKQPKIITDVGHNAEGLGYNMAQLELERQGKLTLLLGFVSDKDLDSIAHLLPKDATYIAAQPDNLRAIAKDEVDQWFNKQQLKAEWLEGSIHQQLKTLMASLSPSDTLYVGGSTFVVAECLDFFS